MSQRMKFRKQQTRDYISVCMYLSTYLLAQHIVHSPSNHSIYDVGHSAFNSENVSKFVRSYLVCVCVLFLLLWLYFVITFLQ